MKNVMLISLTMISLLGCSKGFNIKEMPGTKKETPADTPDTPIIPITSPSQLKWQNTIDFGSSYVGATTQQITVNLKNIGGQTSKTISLTRAGNASQLTMVSDNCSNAQLPINGQCAVTFAFNPNAVVNINDSLTATDTDSNDTLLIKAIAINSSILVSDSNITLNEDSSHSGLVSAIDSAGGTLTYSVSGNVSHGVLSFNSNGNYTYTPNANFNGTDQFTFTVSNSIVNETATVHFSVIPVNDLPTVVASTSLVTPQDTPLTSSLINLSTDVDGDILTFSVVTAALHGTVSINGGNFTYTPTSGFFGSDSFTFRAFDGTGYSNTGVINISVNSTNTAPVLTSPIALPGTEDTVLNANLKVYITDTDTSFTYTITQTTAHGTVSIDASGNLTYTPNANWNGTDTFKFKVNDGQADSNIATVNITVNAVNDAPVIQTPLSFTLDEDTTLNTSVVSYVSDIENDSLTYYVITGPAHGSADIVNGNLTYTPSWNYNGSDSMTFKVWDGAAFSNLSTINFTVNPVNDAPVAVNCSTTNINEDTSGELVCFYDYDSSDKPRDYQIISGPSHGTVTIVDYSIDPTQKAFKYTPDANWNGTDSWTYKVSDGLLWSTNIGTATITVLPVNDAPVATGGSFNTDKNIAYNGLLSASDIDGDSLTFIVVSNPSHGTLSINSSTGSFVYTPTAAYYGSDSFTFKARDAALDSNTATINITVNNATSIPPGNTIPALTDLTLYLKNKDCSSGCMSPNKFNKTDSDGDTMTYSIVTPATGSTAAFNLNGSSYRVSLTKSYTTTVPFTQNDYFTMKRNDGYQDSNTATVNIKYLPYINSVKLGDEVTCVTVQNGITYNDDLYCWGRNTSGQLGQGDKVNKKTPVKVLSNVSDYGIGLKHMCAIANHDGNGTAMWCWGNNQYGQLGDGTTTESLTPKKIFTASGLDAGAWFNSGIKVMAVGYNHSCVIINNSSGSGQLWCWGSNQLKQFTTTFDSNRLSPIKIVSSGVSRVQAGFNHTCFIANVSSNTGSLLCWGNNNSGQLGNSTYTHQSYTGPITVMSNIQDITLGYEVSCATNGSNSLYCWGYNEVLGSQTAPTAYGSVSSTDSLAMYTNTMCVTSYESGKSTACWGKNDQGQLGTASSGTSIDTFANSYNPWTSFFPSDTYYPYIVAGASHSCAIRYISSDIFWAPNAGLAVQGQLYCWGYNAAGELGNGTTTSSVGVPVAVPF